MITFEYKKQFGYLLAIAMFILWVTGKCSLDKSREDNKVMSQNVKALKDTITYKNNKIGTITASKIAFEVSAKELKKQNWIKDEKLVTLAKEFSKLQSATKIKQEVEIVEIPIIYRDSIPCNFERKDSISTKKYRFDYLSNQRGVTISNLSIPNDQYVLTGYKGGGFFSGNGVLTVDVTNTNEAIKTRNIETQVITIPKPFYNKGWFTISVNVGCFVGGYILGRN